MKGIPTFYLTMSLAAVVLWSCSDGEQEGSKNQVTAIPVIVAPLIKSTWEQQIEASGRFAAEDEQMMAFKIGGIIERIYVKEGDPIRKGQLLAKLNPTEVGSLTAQAQFGLEKAERDFERTTKLYADSVATLEQVQNSKTALELARKQYATAEFNLAYSEIRALADGYVLMKMANEGEVVGGGSPVFRTSGNGADWKLSVGLSDKAWAGIAVGDSAVITTDAIAGQQLTSQVIRKSKAAERMSGSFIVELQVDGQYQTKIASGMFGKAVMFPSSTSESWSVPYSALLDANAGKGFVFVLKSDSIALKREVKIEGISGQSVRISDGLEGFDRVIVAGGPYLSDGSKVQIAKTEQP